MEVIPLPLELGWGVDFVGHDASDGLLNVLHPLSHLAVAHLIDLLDELVVFLPESHLEAGLNHPLKMKLNLQYIQFQSSIQPITIFTVASLFTNYFTSSSSSYPSTLHLLYSDQPDISLIFSLNCLWFSLLLNWYFNGFLLEALRAGLTLSFMPFRRWGCVTHT